MPIGLSATELQRWFSQGLSYDAYLKQSPEKAVPWRENEAMCNLSISQKELLRSFKRDMRVLVLSGIWCGDCSSQGPMLAAIASGTACIDLKWLDRDAASKLSSHLAINQGHRVPTVIFMAEDYEPVSVMGDRTLSRYRAKAIKSLGSSCDIPSTRIPNDDFLDTLQDWLNEFERVELLLRLSNRLRQKHGD